MVSVKRNDTALSDLSDRQPVSDVTVNVALNRIADGIEALTDEIRRSTQDHVGHAVIDVNRTYSRAEAARILNVSTRTVDRRVRDGSIHVIRNNKTVRIDGASLRRQRNGEQMVGARRVQKL